MSSNFEYSTPDGQVVSQLRQVRQRSRCSWVFSADLAAFQILLHQVNAPARRIQFVAEDLIGRAGGEAKAAVHAAAQDAFGLDALGRIADEIGELGLHGQNSA